MPLTSSQLLDWYSYIVQAGCRNDVFYATIIASIHNAMGGKVHPNEFMLYSDIEPSEDELVDKIERLIPK